MLNKLRAKQQHSDIPNWPVVVPLKGARHTKKDAKNYQNG
jgi:hypothetical protein